MRIEYPAGAGCNYYAGPVMYNVRALEVCDGIRQDRVRLYPIHTRGVRSDACMIELPKDKTVLVALAKELVRIADKL